MQQGAAKGKDRGAREDLGVKTACGTNYSAIHAPRVTFYRNMDVHSIAPAPKLKIRRAKVNRIKHLGGDAQD